MKPTGFNIKAAAQLSGVSAHTIRAWERRYNAVSPERSHTGRRLYSFSEVDRIQLLMKAVSQGCAISQVAALSDAELRRRLKKGDEIHQSRPGHQNPHARGAESHSVAAIDVYEKIRAALTRFQFEAVSFELSRSRRHFDAETFLSQIAFPLLERLESQVLGRVFRVLLKKELLILLTEKQSAWATSTASHEEHPTVLVASIENDREEEWLIAVALRLTLRGLRTLYLGAHLTSEELIETANACRARSLVLRASLSKGREVSESLFKTLTKFDLGLHPKAEIWLNGSGFDEVAAIRWKHRVRHVDRFDDFEDLS